MGVPTFVNSLTMKIRELKELVAGYENKVPTYAIVNNKKARWTISHKHEDADVIMFFKDSSRKRMYFVVDLSNPNNKGLFNFLRKSNRITLEIMFDWSGSKSETDDYEVYAAFKYDFKDENVYDYGKLKKELSVKPSGDTYHFYLTPEDGALEKVRVHGLDESLRKIYGTYKPN